MRSRMLRVCSRMSLPTSPVTGCRPVWPATKTRLPNLVAGDRLGFGFSTSRLMISFLVISSLLVGTPLVAGDYNAGAEGSTNGDRHVDRGDEHRAGRRGRVPRLVRRRAPAGTAARPGLSAVPALDRRAGPQGLGRDLRSRDRLRAEESGLSGHRRREPLAVVQARHRPRRAPAAVRGRPDPARRPAAARQRRRAVAERDEHRARARGGVQRVVRQGAHPGAQRRPGRPLRAPLSRDRQPQIRRALSPGDARRGAVRRVEEGAAERLDEPPAAELPRPSAPRAAALRARGLSRDPGDRSRTISHGTARRVRRHRQSAGARARRRRLLRHREPRRPPGADRPHVRRGPALLRPTPGRQARAADERAQQRLHDAGALRGVDLGRQRQRQAGPERGVLRQARARPRRPPRARGAPLRRPNQWPQNLPGFRESVLAYTDTVDALGRRLLPLCAAALDLPTDTFDGAFAESQFSFRLTHYPPVAAEANQFGIAPHTDANFMTFLAQTEVPGLQVRMPDGHWVDVPYVPGSFAVNY